MDESPPPAPGGNGTLAQSILNAISGEMLRVYEDRLGLRPAEHVRTTWVGPDVLVVTLRGTLTAAEHELLGAGERDHLRDLRALVQRAEASSLCEPVERLTGRKVLALMSDIDVGADVAADVFVLRPSR